MNDMNDMTNDLVTLNDNDVPTTTSLKVAESFGKQHFHVMEAIRTTINVLKTNDLNASGFRLVDYTDGKGESRPCYELTRNAWAQVVGSFKGEKATVFRKKYADAFDAMEAELQKRQAQTFDPTKLSRMQILQMALESEQERLKLAEKVREDKPKVEAYNDFLSREGLHQMMGTHKMLGLRPRLFFDWLRDNGILYVNSQRRNIPYQRYQDKGYFEIRLVPRSYGNLMDNQTLYTEEGVAWLSRLKRDGRIPERYLAV